LTAATAKTALQLYCSFVDGVCIEMINSVEGSSPSPSLVFRFQQSRLLPLVLSFAGLILYPRKHECVGIRCLYRSPLWCRNFTLVFNNDIRGGNKLLQTPTKEESGMAKTAGPTTGFSKTLGIFFLFLLLILECITHTSLCAFVFLLINRIVYRCCCLSMQQGLGCVCLFRKV